MNAKRTSAIAAVSLVLGIGVGALGWRVAIVIADGDDNAVEVSPSPSTPEFTPEPSATTEPLFGVDIFPTLPNPVIEPTPAVTPSPESQPNYPEPFVVDPETGDLVIPTYPEGTVFDDPPPVDPGSVPAPSPGVVF